MYSFSEHFIYLYIFVFHSTIPSTISFKIFIACGILNIVYNILEISQNLFQMMFKIQPTTITGFD